MKNLIFIVLFIPLVTYGQRKNKMLPVILYTGSIALNAIGDGLNDDNTKVFGHMCNAASIGTLLSIPFVSDVNKKKWYIYIVSYTFIRLALFDITYNATRNLPINYVGNSSITDKFWQKNRPDLFTRGVFLTVGFCLPLSEL